MGPNVQWSVCDDIGAEVGWSNCTYSDDGTTTHRTYCYMGQEVDMQEGCDWQCNEASEYSNGGGKNYFENGANTGGGNGWTECAHYSGMYQRQQCEDGNLRENFTQE